jgi:hypothetical protein
MVIVLNLFLNFADNIYMATRIEETKHSLDNAFYLPQWDLLDN